MFSNQRCAFLILPTLILGSLAAEWLPSPADHAIINTCTGDDVSFAWNFTLQGGDVVQDIQWFYSDDRSNQLVATFVANNFFATPTFSQRVEHLGGAGIRLKNATASDSGNYSVRVSVYHTSGTFTTIERTAELRIAASPRLSGGSLVVTQSRQAVADPVTGQLHVQLTCGTFTDLGTQPVTVLWTSPSGSTIASTSYDKHQFHLLLDNPVLGGYYSCRIDPSSSACFHSDDPSMKEVTVAVDEAKARLTLMEAGQKAENSELKREISNLTEHVYKQDEVINQQTQELSTLTDQIDQQNQVIENLTQNMDHQSKELTTLKAYVHNLESLLSTHYESPTRQVSFHARFSGDTRTNSSIRYRLILDHVISNEGGAYNPFTGEFTAPVNGTYFFIATAEMVENDLSSWYIYANGTDLCKGVSLAGTSAVHGYGQRDTCHATLHLSEGQKVWLYSGNLDLYWAHTYFTGFLIAAD